jgi:hypothetical protein
MIFMTVYVGGITSGEPQPIRFSGLGIFGLVSSLMSVQISGLVSSVRNSLERNNSSLVIKACGSFRTLSTVGPRFYWGNSSLFKWLE